MTVDELTASLSGDAPPSQLPPLVKALWWDAKDDWARAHEIAQDIHTAGGAWVHAYLHRKEGDADNARYWYGQAEKPYCYTTHEAEWHEIVSSLLVD
jgi:hypothetical protein